ncbi:MAG: fimbria major subunit [Muribaculaceae bacterium]|nr:fimbria major subunit [Muribaculaceae bacterium]
MRQHNRHIPILAAALLAFPACSGNDGEGNDPVFLSPDAMVYFNINVKLSESLASRSLTSGTDSSSDGTEPGSEDENRIMRAILVLRAKNSGGKDLFIPVIGASPAAHTTGYTLTAGLSLEEALSFGKSAEGMEYEVFIIANHDNTTYLSLAGGDFRLEDFRYSVTGLGSNLLSIASGLPMSNFRSQSLTIHGWDEETFASHMMEDSPFPLMDTPIEIERSVARIDYRDKCRDNIDGSLLEKEPHTYRVGQSGYIVRLRAMCPFNVSREFFTFRHIYNPDTDKTEFLGRETETNYFLDTDNDIKLGEITALPAEHFINQVSVPFNPPADREGWENVSTDSYLWKDDDSTNGGYTPWIYLPENTIADAGRQLRGFTTGILFRFEITEAPDNAPEERQKGNTLDYYYFIRHNDNDDPEVSGPMEFGVVRNNIYKLSVESVSSFPIPYDPEDPDEPKDPELVVKVAVNDWRQLTFEYDY